MNNRKAIDILNDVIRELHNEFRQSNDIKVLERAEDLDDVRQFLGKDL